MREPAVKKNLDVEQVIRAACLSFPLRSHRKGEETLLTNCDLKDCFLHLRFESNSAIEQDEESLVHIARRNALSWDSFTVSRVGKTNLYQNLHIHGLWTWQHKISIPFTWHKIIPNSENQNRIGRFPDFSSPLAEWKVWLARLQDSVVYTFPACCKTYNFYVKHLLLPRMWCMTMSYTVWPTQKSKWTQKGMVKLLYLVKSFW